MSNPIIKIAAQLARGDFLPRSGRLSARELERLEQQHRDAAVELRKAHDALACPPRPSPYPEAAEALREATAIVRDGGPLVPLVPPDLRGLFFQPEEIAALAASRPNMAPDARQMVERARAADPTAYADAGPRAPRVEYTSDPPQPSPGRVTWYRYTNRHEPDPIWLAVRGDLTFAVSQSAREPIAWEWGIPLRCWRYDERRTVDPVSRPSWAEGEGS